ncbi:hypothetical protein ACEPAF_7392 [Sanghuangporus sanghuang]
MSKFLTFCATLLAFFVATVAAIPQEHLAPAALSDGASKTLALRGLSFSTTLDYQVSETGNPVLRVHEHRQVHNADYGSNNGPSGNPQTEQQTTEAASSTTSAAGTDSDSGAADNDSSEEKKRRDLAPQSSHDINYNQNL